MAAGRLAAALGGLFEEEPLEHVERWREPRVLTPDEVAELLRACRDPYGLVIRREEFREYEYDQEFRSRSEGVLRLREPGRELKCETAPITLPDYHNAVPAHGPPPKEEALRNSRSRRALVGRGDRT